MWISVSYMNMKFKNIGLRISVADTGVKKNTSNTEIYQLSSQRSIHRKNRQDWNRQPENIPSLLPNSEYTIFIEQIIGSEHMNVWSESMLLAQEYIIS